MSKLKPRKTSKFRDCILPLAAAMLGICGMSSNATAADLEQLFKDASAQASQLRRDVGQMESFTRSNLTWQSHGEQITAIKGHVNKMGQTVSQLQAARGDAEKRYQQAIDGILPPLQELASNVEAIINHLNSSPKDLKDRTYQDYLKANVDLATAISQEASDAAAYVTTQQKIQKLQAQLK